MTEHDHGNRNWAYNEAKRRANVMKRKYSIYKSVRQPEHYIIRPTEDVAPDFEQWRMAAVIEPGGGMTLFR